MTSLKMLGLRNALATTLYVGAVAWFLSNVLKTLPNPDKTFLAPAFMLLLFVISAAITGFLVIGKPVMFYMNGEKQQALHLFLYTITWLVIIALIVIVSITVI